MLILVYFIASLMELAGFPDVGFYFQSISLINMVI